MNNKIFSPLIDIDRPKFLEALRLAFAAWCAIAIAIFFKIPNPYWAAMPIWVVSQPYRGLLLEKGFYRIMGSVIGAFAGYLIITFAHSPYLQITLLGFLVGITSGGTLLVRGVISYGFLMIAITASIIVLPSILSPEITHRLVISRLECTLIGVSVVTIITGIFTPLSPRKEFYLQVKKLASDCLKFISLDESINHDDLLNQLSEIDSNARLISAGSIDGRYRLQYVEALISSTLAIMAMPHRRQLKNQFESLIKWLETNSMNSPTPDIEWKNFKLDVQSEQRIKKYIHQLIEAIKNLENIEHLNTTKNQKLVPHLDWNGAWYLAVTAGGATIISAIVGLLSGWKYGELAAMGICIFSIVLGGMPNPRKIAPHLLSGALTGAVVATMYRILIQPSLHSEISVLLSVIPFFLIGALGRVNKISSFAAIDFNMVFLLAGQIGMASTSIINILSATGAIVFAVVLVAMTYILSPKSNERILNKKFQKLKLELKNKIDFKSKEDWHHRSGRLVLQYMVQLHLEKRLNIENLESILLLLKVGYLTEDLIEQNRIEDIKRIRLQVELGNFSNILSTYSI